LLTIFSLSAKTQTGNSYVSDLSSLRIILEKTPSYKDQVRGESLASYNQLYEKLKTDSLHNISDFKYFYNLAQLFFPIQDNHLGFYQIAKIPTESEYPRFEGNVDSLQTALARMPLDSVEGIYLFGDNYNVGLFEQKPKEYIGVVLESKTPIWKKGQIAIHLYETKPNYFKAIYGNPKFKYFQLYQVEKYINHSLVNSNFYVSLSESVYSKVINKEDHVNLPKNGKHFQLETISPEIQYLRIRHFLADRNSIQKSDEFYKSIKNLVNAPNLILDLRNNQGGAKKVSKKFLNLLKHYEKNGQIYVLVNNGTMSQGEIFVLQLKELNNVKVFGQTTRGTLVYGSNYGKREKLPSQAFEVYITDMKGDKRLVKYENYGVTPDIILNDSNDWIEQVMKIIGKKPQYGHK
jgi:hypothetical protein